jgi:hypothetical protein
VTVNVDEELLSKLDQVPKSGRVYESYSPSRAVADKIVELYPVKNKVELARALGINVSTLRRFYLDEKIRRGL